MVNSGASVPPEVPLPSAIDHEMNFSTHRNSERADRQLPGHDRPRCCRSPRPACAARSSRRCRPTRPPIAGHHIQCTGSFSNASSIAVDDAGDADADQPDHRAEQRRSTAAPARRAAATCGMANAGAAADQREAHAGGGGRRQRHRESASAGAVSNSSSSTASSTADTGAAEGRGHAGRRAGGEQRLALVAGDCSSCPSNEPSAPPVAMIGPSAPNGPPVPIAIAADSGLRKVMRGGMFGSR